MTTRFELTRWEPAPALNDMHARADRFLTRAAQFGTQIARLHAPVRTGRLRSSILPLPVRTNQQGRRSGGIWAQAPYALWVEIGTRRMAAQPYLRPALDQIRATANGLLLTISRAGS